MSGGHFDYKQYHINDIVTMIQEEITRNELRPETLAKFRKAVHTLRLAENMAQSIDWLMCNDDSEDAFHLRWKSEVGALEITCASVEAKEAARLRQGIDYWSYCTRMGMLQQCPEKAEELKKFHISCGISPA